jgi:sugar lactone lactonase YvrE
MRHLLFALGLLAACDAPPSHTGSTDGSPPIPGDDARDPSFSPLLPDPSLVPPERLPRRDDTIVVENQQPGDPSWQIVYAAANHEVEGYGSAITLRAGDSLDVMVSVDKPRAVSWVAYRVGWYGGAGARRMGEGGPLQVTTQTACPRDPTTSRVECDWKKTFSWTVPSDAVAGVYLIKLTAADGHEAYVPLVVHDGRAADVVANVNVSSWQAYNAYGGESLYDDASGTMPHGKAWEVSYDRPFVEGHGAGRFLYWEAPMFRWLEALGYDVSYTTALDLTHDPFLVLSARMFLSVANDEYWTLTERNAVESARDAGVNMAFLGADQALWRVRLEPSSKGVADRVIACYKADQDKDPILAAQGPLYATARFRDDPMARPENALIGVMYNTWLLVPQPYVVSDASSWVFAGTGLSAGDSLPGMIAGETDTRYDNGLEPAGLQVIGSSSLATAEGGPWRATSTYYQHASGAQVVAAATFGLAAGVGADNADPRVAKILRNVMDRLVGAGRKGAADPANAPWLNAANTPVVQPAWAKQVTTVAGAPSTAFVPPVIDGPGKGARFAGPDGIAVAADGTVFVADAIANQIRRIANDAAHTVTTYAGDGVDGVTDGPGATARFRFPAGLALAPSGTLYVADADNHTIRAIAPDAAHTVSTYAGLATRSGGFVEGAGASAQFNRPIAIAVDATGALLVSDMHNCRIRRVGTDAAHTVSTLAGSFIGFADGAGTQAQFNSPSGVVIAPDGSVYVLDTFNASIRRVGTDSAHSVTTLVGGADVRPGFVDGAGTVARITGQAGLAWLAGKLYFSDVGGMRIRAVTPGATAAATQLATIAGSGRAALEDGAGNLAALATPMALAAAPDGSLWIADSGNLAIRRLVP